MKRDRKSNFPASLFRFTPAERRGILILLPLLALLGWIVYEANRPKFDPGMMAIADLRDSSTMWSQPPAQHQTRRTAEQRTQTPADHSVTSSGADDRQENSPDKPPIELFYFDPNTVTLQELCRLGFSTRTAAGIIKYRTKGKRFEIPEDFATCYGVTLEHYTILEPYIVIGEQYRAKPLPARTGNVPMESGPADDKRLATLSVIDSLGGDSLGKKQLVRAKIELNSADSAALRSVSGIGPVLVVRIMDYRQRLGGFARVEQLAEIEGMTEANFERISEQISIDTCVISKIDINFASHKTLHDVLKSHPYVSNAILRRLLKQRQLKGGWSSIGDMVSQNIVSQSEAERLAPYLVFHPNATE